MRRLIAAMACVGAFATAQAQLQVLIPTPFGMVVSAGQWLLFNNKRVYYIEVTGSGSTSEEARMNGFRLAVEQALGSVIASETESRNSRIQRDEVISYAAGFVERYEIASTMNTGSGYEIGMRVWVQRNNLAERLLVKSQANGQVDGARAAIAVDTALYSRSQGDLLFRSVLRDFPERSFDIKIAPTEVEMDSYRNTSLKITYLISWNKQYQKSWSEARRSVSTCSWGECVMDRPLKQVEYDEIWGSQPNILLTILSSSGKIKWRACMDFSDLSYIDNSKNSRYTKIPVSSQDLADMNQVEVRVVRAANCPTPVMF